MLERMVLSLCRPKLHETSRVERKYGRTILGLKAHGHPLFVLQPLMGEGALALKKQKDHDCSRHEYRVCGAIRGR